MSAADAAMVIVQRVHLASADQQGHNCGVLLWLPTRGESKTMGERCSRPEDANGAMNKSRQGDRKPFNDNAPRPELMKQVLKFCSFNL